MTRIIANCATTLAVIGMAAAPVAAKKADSVRDLLGMKASSVESELKSRGFEYISGNKSNGYSYTNWWDKSGSDCIQVEVGDGRVLTINDVEKKVCGHSGSGVGTAVAVVAGAALLGALLSRKSNKDEPNKYSNSADQAQYNSGYSAAMNGQPYNNYANSNAYTHGWSDGINKRNDGNGGSYQTPAQFADLRGARAAGADSTMSQRGFRNVDGFKSGNSSYTIWYRDGSRQCIQMGVANGRVANITDIRTHPQCRPGNNYGNNGNGYQPAAQFTDLNGARAAGAETTMEQRGFRNVDGFKNGYTSYTIWYRGVSRQCIQMAVSNGKVSNIMDIQTHPKCR